MKSLVQLKQSDIKPLREKILKEQNNICPICGKKINKPVLDHEHKKKLGGSGQIRAVICSNCNVYLARIENCRRYGILLKELPDILTNILKYLKQDHLPYIHPSEKPKSKKLKKSSYNALKRVYMTRERRFKLPEYPASQKLTVPLKRIYERLGVIPEFYKK